MTPTTTSHHNFGPGIEALAARLTGLRVCDITLRDGEQAVDAAFKDQEKLQVLELIDACQLHSAQIGFAGRDDALVTEAKRRGIRTSLELLAVATQPTWRSDIDAAIDSGVDAINILIRSWEPLLDSMGLSREDVLFRTSAAIRHARDRGAAKIVFGPSFATQADLGLLVQMYRVAADEGADEFLINDSLGVARPDSIARLVREVAKAVSGPVGVHCHNDFGLAVACSLAGAEAGAMRVDLCVNGIGERGGNASLEEFVIALRCLYGVDIGIRTELLMSLSERVAAILRMDIPGNKPVVGCNAFAQKLDIHVRVAAEHPDLFEPYDPALVGNRRWIRLGKGSGSYAVASKITELGLDVPEALIPELVRWVNITSEEEKGFVSDQAFAVATHRMVAGWKD